jgi:hypothetical protein
MRGRVIPSSVGACGNRASGPWLATSNDSLFYQVGFNAPKVDEAKDVHQDCQHVPQNDVGATVETEGIQKVPGCAEVLLNNSVVLPIDLRPGTHQRGHHVSVVVPQGVKAQREAGVPDVPPVQEGTVSNARFPVKEGQKTDVRSLRALRPGAVVGNRPRFVCGVERGGAAKVWVTHTAETRGSSARRRAVSRTKPASAWCPPAALPRNKTMYFPTGVTLQ